MASCLKDVYALKSSEHKYMRPIIKSPNASPHYLLFLHVCLLTHPHTSLLYQSDSLLWWADVDRTKRPHGAESRSVGDSLSSAQAPQNKGGTVSLGITHFEFQVYLNQSIGNIFLWESVGLVNKPNCGCRLPVHSQTVGLFIMWFFIYQQCFANC